MLGQKKLFQRLVPGLVHAAIFWGFLVLFPTIVVAMIGAVDKDATLPWLGHQGWFALMVDLFALLVLCGVIAAFLIRKVQRPARFEGSHLGEADLILALIAGIVTTLLLWHASRIALGLNEWPASWSPVSDALSGLFAGRRVLSESTAYLMASMLADVVNHGTGYSARQSGFRLPAGGKTGSTDDHADAWFIGFTPQLAAGVWVGFDRPQQIMRRGFASVVAVPAWAGFMKAADHGNKPEWLTRPSGVTHIRRCRASGGLATEYCELPGEVDNDYVSIGRAPDLCPLHSSTTLISPVIAPIAFGLRPSP